MYMPDMFAICSDVSSDVNVFPVYELWYEEMSV